MGDRALRDPPAMVYRLHDLLDEDQRLRAMGRLFTLRVSVHLGRIRHILPVSRWQGMLYEFGQSFVKG